MAQGYIYVLANSSMPNVVKVGKTNRQPSTRAQELSGVTGVPTPFIVVYEKLFNDCDSAELTIHELLSQKGYRVSSNREFFNAPVPIVIECIMSASAIDADSSSEIEDDDDFFGEIEDSELNSLEFEHNLPVWFSIWSEAENNFWGLEDHLVDYDEAIKCYKNAISLGCIAGYAMIAQCYEEKGNTSKAFEWLKQGANKNNYICYLRMATQFLIDGNDTNFFKCLSLFVKSAANHQDNLLEELLRLDSELFGVISLTLTANLDSSLPESFREYSTSRADKLVEHYYFLANIPNFEINDSHNQTLEWVQNL